VSPQILVAHGVFFVWDGAFLDGPHGLNEAGGLSWNEVLTDDAAKTIAFYRQSIGWNIKEQPKSDGPPYAMFAGRDRPSWTHGGIRALPASGPSTQHWMSYFEVPSCEQSVEFARRLGAQITAPAARVPGVGWIATFLDREGSSVGLFQTVA
jgi:predicted enzyme related to lactoylglutathione lyase